MSGYRLAAMFLALSIAKLPRTPPALSSSTMEVGPGVRRSVSAGPQGCVRSPHREVLLLFAADRLISSLAGNPTTFFSFSCQVGVSLTPAGQCVSGFHGTRLGLQSSGAWSETERNMTIGPVYECAVRSAVSP